MAEYLSQEAVCDDSDRADDDIADKIDRSELALFSGFICDDVVNDSDHSNPYVDDDITHVPYVDDDVHDITHVEETADGEIQGRQTRVGGNSPAVHWVFTLNNYTEVDEANIAEMGAQCQYIVYGREVGASNTPHLQGYLKLLKKMRFTQVQRLFVSKPHIEKCKMPSKAITYCMKGEDYVEIGDNCIEEKGGRKMIRIIEHFRNGGSVKDIVGGELCHLYVTNRQKINEVLKSLADEEKFNALTKRSRNMLGLLELYPWQEELHQIMQQQHVAKDSRTVNWLYDIMGGVGKSYFAEVKKLSSPSTVAIYENEPFREISYVYSGEEFIFFDFAKNVTSFDYATIEKIKNGRALSTKYEPKFKMFNKPIVVVFSNVAPDVSKMSKDRWNVFRLERDSAGCVSMKHQLYSSLLLA